VRGAWTGRESPTTGRPCFPTPTYIRFARRDAPGRSAVSSTPRAGHRGPPSGELAHSSSHVSSKDSRDPATFDALSRRGPCRHRALIVESILDARGGIQSIPELDFELIRRRHGLPEPLRQSIRRRRDGKCYLDAEWPDYDTACEIHGIPHIRVAQWESDLARANEIVIAGPRLLVFSSYAVRRQQPRVGDQLVRMLRRGGWPG
jgi:hypothetical protein